MNHGDTDDTEKGSGDEGNPPPIHDIPSDANDDSKVEQAVEPTSVYSSLPSEVADQPVIVANEDEVVEVQTQTDTHFDWQTSVVEESSIPLETGSEALEPEKVKTQPSGWQWVRNFFSGSADVLARLNNLTQAIEEAPESAVNYVLRAELYMTLREYALAQADFQRAFELAEVQFELADWGLLDQVMRDRALCGLDKVQRRLR